MKFKKKTGDSADPPKINVGESLPPQIGSGSALTGGFSGLPGTFNSNTILNPQHKQSNFGFIRKGTMPNTMPFSDEYNSMSQISTIQQPENNSLNLSQTYSNMTNESAKPRIPDYSADNIIENEQILNYDSSLPIIQYDQPTQIPNYDEVINYNNNNLNDSHISESNSNTGKKAIISNDSEDANKPPTNYKPALFGLNIKSRPRVLFKM